MPYDCRHGFQCGDFAVEPLKGSVTGRDRQSRHVPPKAMEVLICLAAEAKETLTREELLDRVWGERCVSDEVLTHAITELRHALGDDPSNPTYIETIPKRGYRLLKSPLPYNEPGQRPLGHSLGPEIREGTSHGSHALWRNPAVLVSFVVGTLAILAVVFSLPRLQEDAILSASSEIPSSTSSPANSTTEAGQARSQSTLTERLLKAESLQRRVTSENIRQEELLLVEVLSMDSQNAAAWSQLGRIYYLQTRLFHSRPVHADLAWVNMTFDFDFEEAFQHLRKAQNLSPMDPHVLEIAAKMEIAHNHLGHSIDLLEQSISIDPYSCMEYVSLGEAYYFANRLDDAEKVLEKSLSLNPGVVRSRYLLGLVRLAKNSTRSALAMMEQERDEELRMVGIAIVRYALDDKQASDEVIDILTHSSNRPTAYHMATLYEFRGQHNEALDWLELAYEQRDDELPFLLMDPLLVGLRSEPRWKRLVEKLGLPHQI
jgi:DNA-binding winged helix-turn-helix (wHTH) protein/cytochrome c-type biogenesis protein CcmH/NrfG